MVKSSYSGLNHTPQLAVDDEETTFGHRVARTLLSDGATNENIDDLDCFSCTTCKGVSAPTVCQDGVPDSTISDPAARYNSAAATTWFNNLQCPFPRSMWIISTLTPGHPREHHIVDSMAKLTASTTWAVLFVSTQQTDGDDAGDAPPIISRLGRNVAVMNLSLATLRSMPLESSKMLVKLLKDRSKTEWGRVPGSDPMLTAQDRLHMALKMIPYLVAVKCGVSAIFDTVDDELPNFLPGLQKVNPDMVSGPFQPKERSYYALPPEVPEPPLDDIVTWPVLLTPRADVAPVINPYASIGNRVIHPRGFPTEWIYNASFQVLHIQRALEPVKPWVQQWVPHAHPDLSFTDMTNLRTHLLPKVMKDAPNIVLDQWAWAPYNARGTLFLPGAFWTMFLSPSQPNYFTDTLRAYWSQRLLWDMGATVSYRSTRSASPPESACGSDFGFHQDRIDGHCDGSFTFRDVMGPRKKRVKLIEEEAELQALLPGLLTYLDEWEYQEPATSETPQLTGLPPLFRKAMTLMCNLGESSQLANCKDCYALRAWLRDLTAAGYKPPAAPGAKPRGQDTFAMQYPSRANLVFDDKWDWRNDGGKPAFRNTIAEMYRTPKPTDKHRELAVCLSGLADRIDIRLEPEDFSLPPYKRPKVKEDLLLDFNLRALAPGFGGIAQMHHFYVLGSFNTYETNLHVILQGRLPFVAIAVHRDWVLEPLLPPDEQCRMERFNSTWVRLHWTNEAQHYQRSQLHQVRIFTRRSQSQVWFYTVYTRSTARCPPISFDFRLQVWEEGKCFEMATWFMRRHGLRYKSFMRHRSDFNITLTPFENRATIKEWTSKPEWKDVVYVPRGKDYRVSASWRSVGGLLNCGGSCAHPFIYFMPRSSAGYKRPLGSRRLRGHVHVHVPLARPPQQAVGAGPSRLQSPVGGALPQLDATRQ